MFGIGWQELIVIFIVLLIFVGPKKLPEVAKSISKAIREFARAKEEVKRNLSKQLSIDEDSYLEIKEEGKEKQD
ncbi:MAG: Sec-independent protein translocase protein TatB [Candidatus Calescibacterium sp.]|jgi:Tat protein translocase TatB subunit|nr:Sec-independent protein translocase protein TatB [Candidatus Calescibacterium sp.]